MSAKPFRAVSGGLLAGTLFLAACAPQSDYFNSINKGVGTPPSDTCGAADFAWMIGQPASILGSVTLIEPYRIIPAGAPVTTDYMPGRLNIGLDVTDTIARLSCG